MTKYDTKAAKAMFKVGDMVRHKRAANGTMRGIVVEVAPPTDHKEIVDPKEVRVQWFPTSKGKFWVADWDLALVSGAVYNCE